MIRNRFRYRSFAALAATLATVTLVLPYPATASNNASPEKLAAILSRMDQAGPIFQSMQAQIKKVTHTHVIDDNSTESGMILLRKLKPKGLQMKVDFTQPDPKSVAFGGRKAEVFYPKLKLVQEYDLGKQSSLVDQFLLVGFGTTGQELAANYTLTFVAEETVAGQKTIHLKLLPKRKEMGEKLKQLDLWVAESGAYPVQQKFLQPSGDYTVFTFSDVKVNPPLKDNEYALKLPSGVKREYPQK